MKKRIALICTFFLLVFTFLPVQADTDVVITSFDIDMVVDENGLITVDQVIDTQFNIMGHGIYAYIPQNYDMSFNIDGETYERSYYFPIRKLNVIGDPYESQIDNYGNLVLKIGDADQYVSGAKSYHYTYTMQLRDLDLNGFQAFYLNLVGDGWEMPIGQVRFSITLPNGWPEGVEFYSGYNGNEAATDVIYRIDGNTLSGTFGNLSEYQALTIYQPLPDGYFTFIPPTDYSVIAIGVLAAMSILIAFIYLRFGRDEKAVETVEFNPIPGISSAQTGFIYDGFVDTKDVISLIIEWAYKGYLSITEDETGKNFTLTKLMDINPNDIRAEKTLFNALFAGRDVVTKAELQNSFYISLMNAKTDILRHFQGTKARNVFSNAATGFKVLTGIITMIPVGLLIASQVYLSTYQIELAMIAGAVTAVFGSILTIAVALLVKRWPAMKPITRSLGLIGVGILTFFIVFIFLGAALMLSTAWWKVILTLALTAANIGFVSVMDRRTELGTEYLGKILGLKNFIEVAEKDKLEMLVHDDPTYFYKILPYAYVLNVSDVWSKKFESIAMEQPNWYRGPHMMNNYMFMNSMTRTMNSMSQVMSSIPQSRASGGFRGGGGGGGFSGGGFGGGGGGHW